MRRNLAFLLGTVTGACLTVAVTGPQGRVGSRRQRPQPAPTPTRSSICSATCSSGSGPTMSRSPTIAKLIEASINGMITALDPHSRYMNEKGWSDMQETTHGEFGGLGIEVTMEDGLVKVVDADRRHARRQGRHALGRPDHPDRRRGHRGHDPGAGGRPDEGAGQQQDPAQDHAQGCGARRSRFRSCARSSGCGRSATGPRAATSAISGSPRFNEQTTEGLKKAIAGISKEIPADKLTGYVRRPPQQSRRIARPGGVGVERVHVARRGRLHTRPHCRGDPALYGARRRPHQGQAAGRADQRRIGVGFRDRGRRAARPQARAP